jgi:hypothetical protein
MKVRCELHPQNFKVKYHSQTAKILRRSTTAKELMYFKIIQANACKHKLDACEKLRQQGPRARKVLSRSAIKKAIGKKFRFGKDHVDVQNNEGKWIKVPDRRFYRVYIPINHPKRIKLESVVPFYGKAPRGHLVLALCHVAPFRSQWHFYFSVFHRGEVSALP